MPASRSILKYIFLLLKKSMDSWESVSLWNVFFWTVNISFPLMTEHSSARRRRMPVLSCSRKKTSTLPVCSVILSRNIWHLLESLPPRSIVSVWTGNSAAAADIPQFTSTTERACICPECGQIEYPKISPAVIIAIVDTERDKILLTRYAGGSYRHWALVAGFVEVGETFKGAARREIMEEVGLKVSDLVYYKSQPWSFSDSAMIGFFAKLEGDPSITLQESELGEAVWFSREDVPDLPSTISVGQEMITLFKNGGDPFCQR